MLGIVGLALAALFNTSSANADQWHLTYSGGSENGNVIFTDTPIVGNTGQITSATGTIDGAAITGLSGFWGADNILITTGSTFANQAGIGLATATNSYNLFDSTYWGGRGTNTGMVISQPNVQLINSEITFTLSPVTLSPVPEPTEGALLLSGIGLLGFVASRRKKAV